ncbi:hypothetical protein EV361DRAFT_325125 [Lentinula raphanica]|uniref:Uncharacterized protein n=1 Tax=Lentinula raphanica TaxID=153919 RepID=A0AA38UGU8_9AGAR|nr:hypothetical protein F5878DRAFT_612720 [Lentinula raphanica]KAJ3969819.1 hypothetical protein EV361DRAFT_325125 [Lentinula raphanica]
MQQPALSSFSISAAFPHPVKQEDITIPRSLLYLIVSSLFVSFLLLIVSFLDLGYCSLWLTPPLCLFTLLYFAGVLFLSRMERTAEEPTYFPTVVFIGYIMTILWLVAFILTVVVFAVYPNIVAGLRHLGLHTVSVGLQRFECLLCMTNLGLVGGFTARSHVIAMEEGDPENWRILIEKNQNPAARLQIRVHHHVNLNDPSMIQEPREAPAPTIQPDWITAAVLEDNMAVAPRTPKPPPSPCPQIEISPPGPVDDLYDEFYMNDYQREEVPVAPLSPRTPLSPRAPSSPQASHSPVVAHVSRDEPVEAESEHYPTAKERFEQVYSPHQPVFSPDHPVHASQSPYRLQGAPYDTDSAYDDSEPPETPDRWSDEDEVEEEFHAPHLNFK